ncbi:hypothetical protein [Rhodococcus erythropolis]|uniref:hypothetical protein n=1 Tax=Rhodococcus erythropolis TaxID=1833 RepID=UPI00036006F5|nr:hypothetical protein [Rhodococcus erythropolis]EQM33473.1 hypothetical protein N601_11525 [Rhodococcus erythropolis DN1]
MSQQATNQLGRTGAESRHSRALINREELNPLPTIKSRDGGVDFVANRLGVPMTPTRMRAAIERRELPVYKISGANYLAERDLYDWVLSLAQTGKIGAA